MSNKDQSASRRRLDKALKSAFEAKAAEPVPTHLIEMSERLDAPSKRRLKAG